MQEINRLLAIRHVTGSSYHPQSQGIVESMHRKINGLVRALVDEDPECWEAKIPYCQAILRIIPLKALGGRSPYEVVIEAEVTSGSRSCNAGGTSRFGWIHGKVEGLLYPDL